MSRLPFYLLALLVSAVLAAAAAGGPSAGAASPPSAEPASAPRTADARPIAPPRRFFADLNEGGQALDRALDSFVAGATEVEASGDITPFIDRLPAMRADLATFEAAMMRLRQYRLVTPGLERRRAALAVAGPRLAAVFGGFLNAVQADDGVSALTLAERLDAEIVAFDRAAAGTPNVAPGRLFADLGTLNRVLDRIERVVRRPTRAGMRAGRASLVSNQRAFTAAISRMRGYRLDDDDLEARRARAVTRSRAFARALSSAIAQARGSRAVSGGKRLRQALRAYETQLR